MSAHLPTLARGPDAAERALSANMIISANQPMARCALARAKRPWMVQSFQNQTSEGCCRICARGEFLTAIWQQKACSKLSQMQQGRGEGTCEGEALAA